MKLKDLVNVKSPGDKTNLTGGNIPNSYTDDPSKGVRVRKKKKDVYGTINVGSNSSGDGGGE